MGRILANSLHSYIPFAKLSSNLSLQYFAMYGNSTYYLLFISDAKIRLVDGTDERQGRVEIMYQGI